MPHRAAIIDLGTNTFHILIMEWEEHRYKVLDKLQIPVKLGKGAFEDRQIKEDAYARGITAIIEFRNLIDTYHISQIEAYGTSALRNALNGPAFRKEAESVLGYPIAIIDGQREAELIYEGVRRAVPMGNEAHLIVDIGGGSVEFIIADEEHIHWKKSYEIGAARLIERFCTSDPISELSLTELEIFLEKELSTVWIKAEKYQVRTLIGASGSFESLASMEMEMYHSAKQAPQFLHHILDLGYFEEIYQRIRNSRREELMMMPGLPQFRVEMIMVALVMVRVVLRQLKIRKFIASDYALKEGVMFNIMGKTASNKDEKLEIRR